MRIGLGSAIALCGSVLLLPACSSFGEADDTTASSRFEVRAAHLGPTLEPTSADGTGRYTTGISVRGADGLPIQLSPDTSVISVETRSGNDAWTAARDVVADHTSPPLIDVMLVADNSGSVAEELADIKQAINSFAHVLLAREHDDRVGLVRVSTEAALWQGLTEDPAELQASIDRMFGGNGWTALWDGVRLANDSLNDGSFRRGDNRAACYAGSYPSIVVITDGRENNSIDQHQTRYAGDGIDTVFDDLTALEVRGRPTSVHTVAVGADADRRRLSELARQTGGHATVIGNYGQLVGTLHGTAAQLDSITPVCFAPADCAHDQARITLTVRDGTIDESVAITAPLPATCPSVP